MDIRVFDDPVAFRDAGGPLLLADPARSNLPLGILDTLIHHPDTYPIFHLWLAERDGTVVGACLRTDPYNVVLAEPSEPQAIDALCDVVAATLPDAPGGVVANPPWAERFVARWSRATGDRATKMLTQGVYALTSVRDPRPAPGAHRPCRAADGSAAGRSLAAHLPASCTPTSATRPRTGSTSPWATSRLPSTRSSGKGSAVGDARLLPFFGDRHEGDLARLDHAQARPR